MLDNADNVDINFADTGERGNAILGKIQAMREAMTPR